MQSANRERELAATWRERFQLGLRAMIGATLICAAPHFCQAEEDDWSMGSPEKPMLALDTGGHTNAVYKVIVSGYGDQLISVSIDKTIRIWDLNSGEPLRVLRPPLGPKVHGYLFSAALSPDDKLLAVGCYRALTPLHDHRIHLIDLGTGQIIHSLKGHVYTIYDLAFSPDGKRLASASHDNTIRIWDVESGTTLKVLRGHTEPVHAVAWNPEGTHVVSGSLDKTARIWSVDSGSTLALMREHRDQIMTVGWSPDGRTIATGCNDKVIRLYEPTGKFRYSWNLPNEIMSLKFSPDSKRLLYTYGSNTEPPQGAAILDMVKGAELVSYRAHDNSPICCAFTPDGKRVVTGDSISQMRVWDSHTGKTLNRLDGRGHSMISAGWSPDGQAIAWGTSTEGNTTSRGSKLERTFCLRNLDFGPPPDSTFVRARIEMGGLRMGFNVSERPIDRRKVAFEANGNILSTFTLPQTYDQVRCYSLLPNMRSVIGSQGGAMIVNIQSGLVEHELSDRGEEIWGLSPSPNFKYVLTAGNDQVMRVWRLDNGEMLVALYVADEEWIAWTPQGYYAASLAGESLMGWHVNRGPDRMSDFYPAAQFHKSLYRPDVIRRLLEAGNLTRAIEIADRERSEQSEVVKVADVLPAEVTITSPSEPKVEQSESKITIRASAQPADQPLTAMQLLIDGRPFGPSRTIGPQPEELAAKVEQEWTVDLPPGKYNVAVKAETNHNYALSRPVEVTRKPAEGDPLPKLHVLSVGPLPNDDTPASVSKAMAAAGKGAFGSVETHVLTGEQATPEAVNAELDRIRSQATLADTTLIYYAGRETLDTAGHYRLLAARGNSQDPAGVWFSDHEWKRKLASIPGRVMLAVDTTRMEQQTSRDAHAGFCGSSSNESADRLDKAASDFLRDLLTEEYGITILRGARKASAASTQKGASAFSRAFVEGIGGQADRDHDGTVQLHELSRYLNERVRTLTKGQQNPVIERPQGVRSFPIAKPPAAAESP